MRSLKTNLVKSAFLGSVAITAISMASPAMAQGRIPSGPTFKLKSEFLSYNLSVSTALNVTDNPSLVRSDSPFKQTDVFGTITTTGGLIMNKNRITAIANGTLYAIAFANPSEDFGGNDRYEQYNLNLNGQAGATFKAIDNLLYVDVAAAASQRPLGINSVQSANLANTSNQQADAYSVGVSPYILHRFPNAASFEARYRVTNVTLDDEGRSFGTLPFDDETLTDSQRLERQNRFDNVENFLNDSETKESLFEFRTGGMFDRIQATLTAQEIDVEETGSDEGLLPEVFYNQKSAQATLEYALSRQFSLAVTYGQDEIETETTRQVAEILSFPTGVPTDNPFDALFFQDEEGNILPPGDTSGRPRIFLGPITEETTEGVLDNDKLSGPFWNIGFVLNPGRRTNIRAGFGERFDGDWVNVAARYRMSERLIFIARASRQLQTGINATSSSSRLLQQQTLSFVDSVRSTQEESSNELIGRASNFANGFGNYNAAQQGLSASDTASAGLIYKSGGTELSINYSTSFNDFGYEEAEFTNLAATLERRISRRLLGYGEISVGSNSRQVSGTFDECRLALQSDPLYAANGPEEVALFCLTPENLNGDSKTLEVKVGAEYTVNRDFSGFAEFTHQTQDSDAAIGQFTVDENVFTVGATYRF